MTTQSNLRIGGLIASIFIVSNSFAQLSTVKNLQPALNKGTAVKIYENVNSEFQKLFQGAEDVSWEKVQGKYLAKFSIDGVKQRALFNPKAKLVYKIIYGTEKHLPADIRKFIKRSYVEFNITAATLVEEANRSIWVINVEDDSKYVIVRAENNEIEEVKSYAKMKS